MRCQSPPSASWTPFIRSAAIRCCRPHGVRLGDGRWPSRPQKIASGYVSQSRPKRSGGGADGRDPAVRALGLVEPEAGERGEQLEADADPLLPALRRLARGRHRVQRQPAAEEQRVADPHPLVAAVGQPELGAQRRAGAEQVAPRARRRVDRDDRAAAPEALDRARDLLDGAGRVERRHELDPALRRAPLVQRHELLVGRLGGDVDAAVAHAAVRLLCGACRPRRAARRADARAGRHPVGVARRGRGWPPTSPGCCATAASPVRDLGDTCVLAGPGDAPVLLAGHLDTVPAQDNRPGPDRGRPRARPRRERHEGRAAR